MAKKFGLGGISKRNETRHDGEGPRRKGIKQDMTVVALPTLNKNIDLTSLRRKVFLFSGAYFNWYKIGSHINTEFKNKKKILIATRDRKSVV